MIVADGEGKGDGGAAAEHPRRLAVGTALAVAAQVGPLVAATVLSVVIARLLGPTGTGGFSLVLTTFDVILLVFTFGLSGGITYYVSRRTWTVRSALRETSLAALVAGLGGIAAGVVFYALARDNVLEGVSRFQIGVALAALPFALAWAFAAAIALGRDRYEAYTMLELVNAAVMLVVGVTLAATSGLSGAVVGFALAQVGTAVAGAWWGHRAATALDDPAHPGEPGQLRPAFSFGLKSWGANLVQLLNYRADLFILAAYASLSDVGVYSIALSVTGLGWVLPSALTTVLFPRTASLDAAVAIGSVAATEADEAAASATRHAVLIMIPTALALAALLLVAVPVLYGPSFHETIALGFILIPEVVILGLGKVGSAVYSGRGFPIYGLWSALSVGTVTVILYFVLIPGMGATGAAVASTISYTATTVLAMFFYHRTTGIGMRRALVPTRGDIEDYRVAARLAWARLRPARG